MLDCLRDIPHTPSFKLLSDIELGILNQNKTTVNYKKNDILLKQGTIANNIIFSKSGLFKLYIEGDHKNVILTLKGSQVFLGLSCLFHAQNTYLYTVIAVEDCEVDIYDVHHFKTVLARNAAFSNEIISYLNHNSARIFRRYINLTEKNARGKVANMLLCFANSIYFNNSYHLTLSRQELAEYLGLSMENIVRILKEFETDQLVNVDGKDIELLDTKTLQEICNYG